MDCDLESHAIFRIKLFVQYIIVTCIPISKLAKRILPNSI